MSLTSNPSDACSSIWGTFKHAASGMMSIDIVTEENLRRRVTFRWNWYQFMRFSEPAVEKEFIRQTEIRSRKSTIAMSFAIMLFAAVIVYNAFSGLQQSWLNRKAFDWLVIVAIIACASGVVILVPHIIPFLARTRQAAIISGGFGLLASSFVMFHLTYIHFQILTPGSRISMNQVFPNFSVCASFFVYYAILPQPLRISVPVGSLVFAAGAVGVMIMGPGLYIQGGFLPILLVYLNTSLTCVISAYGKEKLNRIVFAYGEQHKAQRRKPTKITNNVRTEKLVPLPWSIQTNSAHQRMNVHVDVACLDAAVGRRLDLEHFVPDADANEDGGKGVVLYLNAVDNANQSQEGAFECTQAGHAMCEKGQGAAFESIGAVEGVNQGQPGSTRAVSVEPEEARLDEARSTEASVHPHDQHSAEESHICCHSVDVSEERGLPPMSFAERGGDVAAPLGVDLDLDHEVADGTPCAGSGGRGERERVRSYYAAVRASLRLHRPPSRPTRSIAGKARACVRCVTHWLLMSFADAQWEAEYLRWTHDGARLWLSLLLVRVMIFHTLSALVAMRLATLDFDITTRLAIGVPSLMIGCLALSAVGFPRLKPSIYQAVVVLACCALCLLYIVVLRLSPRADLFTKTETLFYSQIVNIVLLTAELTIMRFCAFVLTMALVVASFFALIGLSWGPFFPLFLVLFAVPLCIRSRNIELQLRYLFLLQKSLHPSPSTSPLTSPMRTRFPSRTHVFRNTHQQHVRERERAGEHAGEREGPRTLPTS